MGARQTGTAKSLAIGDGVYRSQTGRMFVRLRLPNGERRRIWLKPGLSDEYAREQARAMRERIRENPGKYKVHATARSRGPLAKPDEVTVAKYSEQWFANRETRGLSSIKTDRGRMKNHVLPKLGELAMMRVASNDLRAVVEELDNKVRAQKIKSSTAIKVWGLVTKMFSDACESKTAKLRIRSDNPCKGVRGPDREPAPEKQWLFPREATQLLACEEAPLRWRRLYALAIYLYVRPGELAALEWRDVHLDHGLIKVRRALNLRTGKEKGVKTSRNGGVVKRNVPIHPALLPLLKLMHKEADGKGRVIQYTHQNKDAEHGFPPLEDLARTLREHLKRAGVDRADLHHTDDSSRRVVFYSLRDTGTTWEVLAGTDHVRIMQRAGHRSFETTKGYVHAVDDLRLAANDVPFPPLPEALCGQPTPGQLVAHHTSKCSEALTNEGRPQRDSNAIKVQDYAAFSSETSVQILQAVVLQDANLLKSRSWPSGGPDFLMLTIQAIHAARSAGQTKLARALTDALLDSLDDEGCAAVLELMRGNGSR